MIRQNLKEMYFSQYALSTYDTCYLKFRRRYIDGLYWPGNWVTDQQQRESMEQGQLFHLLAYRYYSGIEMGDLAGTLTEPVAGWFDALRSFRPVGTGAVFLPEQELRYNQGGLRLLAKFDLLMVLPDGRVVIYDWKTSPNKPKSQYYARNIQTIVYRYILAKAGGPLSPKGEFTPADISMVYWNPRYPKLFEPLAYSGQECRLDETIIRQKIRDIENRKYEEFYAASDERKCAYCEYSPLCHGRPMNSYPLEEGEDDLELDWDAIDEMLFE